MATHQVILVPGFLGFQKLWDLPYFADAQRWIEAAIAERGVQARIRAIRTLPTASLGQRAARLAEVVDGIPSDDPVHLIGHSTGGLDARLFVAPGVTLPTSVDVERAASRVVSLVSIATPHHGTPLATYMTGVHGHRFLRLFATLLTGVLHRGSASLVGVSELAKAVFVLGRITGVDPRVARALGRELTPFLHLPEGEDDSVRRLLQEMGEDNALLEQLTPASLELFNNATRDRDGVRYGSVVAMAPRPNLGGRLRLGVHPWSQLTYGLFGVSHRLTSSIRLPRLPHLTADQSSRLRRDLGLEPDRVDSDGLVPTLSQVWGTVVHAVRCDHLDLMGYFGGDASSGAMDLLACGAGFTSAHYEALWDSVVGFSFDGGPR